MAVIEIKKISKRYNIVNHRKAAYKTLRDSMADLLTSPFNKGFKESKSGFYALKNISFSVDKGEVIGVIGSNGAGKSTLFKILSRITTPTNGEVVMKGKVSSLLEVGTGFHPELSGRENVFLNGIMLGMSKGDVKKRFNEIVEFSGIEKFIDTPIKFYSSGMYVRLAFSIAAYLDPDVMLIDEVLAVGDLAFQKKCLNKIDQFTRTSDKTILIISHNIETVRTLCKKTVLLNNGEIYAIGDTELVVQEYYKLNFSNNNLSTSDAIRLLPKDEVFEFLGVDLHQNNRYVNDQYFYNNEAIEVDIRYKVHKKTIGLRVYFDILTQNGDILIRSFHDENNESISVMEAGEYISKAIIPANLLSPHNYKLCIRGTIYNYRTCTGDGLKIDLCVQNRSMINSNYLGDTIRSSIMPFINWNTKNV